MSTSGSPPHAWGIRTWPMTIVPCRPVHPHTRGEYADFNRKNSPVAGSPPHAWGIRNVARIPPAPLRFTPTRVGNTPQSRLLLRPLSGSPPHAWGILCRMVGDAPCVAVHPHTRGEYAGVVGIDLDDCGSPPHAWGIPPARIPCYCVCPVHPHTRGEYCQHNTLYLPIHPVHPHTRGEYSTVAVLADGAARFTPTRVGNTPPHSAPPPAQSVHPHTRGEYAQVERNAPKASGSPPHAWGILAASAARCAPSRFTPTRVGNTRRG